MITSFLISVASLALAETAAAQPPAPKAVPPAGAATSTPAWSPASAGGGSGQMRAPAEPRDPTEGGATRVKPGSTDKNPPATGGMSGGAAGGTAGDPKPPKLDAMLGGGAVAGLPGDAATADFKPIVNPPVGGGGEAATTDGGTPIGGALGGVLGGSGGGGGPKRATDMTDGTSRIQTGPGGGPRAVLPAQAPPPDQRAADAARRARPR